MQYLGGPNLEIVPIAAMIPFQINAEVEEKDCDYLLYSTLVEKEGTSGGFMKRAMPLASMIPMAGALGGMVAGAATSVAITSEASLSSNVKARSEMTLSYKLVAIHQGAETSVLENTLTAKAKQDGEDIISPLVEQEATAIVTQLSSKK